MHAIAAVVDGVVQCFSVTVSDRILFRVYCFANQLKGGGFN